MLEQQEAAVQRVAFQLRIRPGKIEEYDEAHRHVWPELLAEMESFGIREYSIFRCGQQLFLYMQVDDFGAVSRKLASSELNRRWQLKMASLFEPAPDPSRETFSMMREVFYMPGR